ncbi:MAG: helix-turn-helix transcriptional regulator [Defluviitaleaceae bacterium]|nr:helix-turn-helix transcriptional regulator [Defluviitaleaceae bacterium]
MKKRNITAYALVKKHGFNSANIFRLRHNEYVSTYMINKLCKTLNCTVEEVLLFKPDDEIEQDGAK